MKCPPSCKRNFILSSCCTKKRKAGKPWWNDDLSVKWNDVCISETIYLQCTDIVPRKDTDQPLLTCRKEFKNLKDCFGSNYRKIGCITFTDPDTFWKSIRKIGAGFWAVGILLQTMSQFQQNGNPAVLYI